MRKVTKILIGFVLLLFLCVSSFAQIKIAVVDSKDFYDEKSGIIELVNVNKKSIEELKPIYDKLESDYKEIQKLQNELEEFANKPNTPKTACPPTELVDEKIKKLEQLQSLFKLKINEANIEFKNREKPVIERINAKLKIFKKNKSYAEIFDKNKFDEEVLADPYPDDVTIDFIKFCNEEFEKEKARK